MWFSASLRVAVCLAGMATSIYGWGWLGSRLFLPRAAPAFVSLAPLGLALLYIAGGVLSLLVPLNGAVDWLAVGGGWIAAAVAVRSRRVTRQGGAVLAAALPLLALVAAGTAVTPVNFDAGLYHLQLLKYVETQPLPFGIANIHERFGFNSATLPLSALFHGSVFGADGAFLLSAVLFLLFALDGLHHAAPLWRSGAPRFSAWFSAVVLCVWLGNLHHLLFDWFSLGPNGDVPGAVFCCWTFLYFFLLLESAPDDPRRPLHLLLFALCSALSVTTKLSQAPVLLLIPALWFLGVRPAGQLRRPALLAGAVVAVWLAFGLVASGCLAFPAGASCVTALPWAIAPNLAEKAGDAVRAWARAPGMAPILALSGWDWFAAWQTRMLPNRPVLPALLYTAGASLLLAGLVRLRARIATPALLAALAVATAGLAAWFWIAPDPRFGLGCLLVFPALLGAAAGAAAPLRGAGRTVALLLLGLGTAAGVELIRHRASAPTLAWRVTPPTPMREVVTRSGLPIRVPVEGEQCWDDPGICAPTLRLRIRRFSVLGRPAFTLDPRTPSGPTLAGYRPAPGAPIVATPIVVLAAPDRRLPRETAFSVLAFRPGLATLRLPLAAPDGPRDLELLAREPFSDLPRPADALHPVGEPRRIGGGAPESLEFSVRLAEGNNRFLLRSSRDCPAPGACFLLLGEIAVDQIP